MEPYPYPYALSQPQKSEDQIYTSPYTVASSIQTSEGGGYILQPSAQQTPNFEKSNMDSQLVIQKFEELSSCYYPQGPFVPESQKFKDFSHFESIQDSDLEPSPRDGISDLIYSEGAEYLCNFACQASLCHSSLLDGCQYPSSPNSLEQPSLDSMIASQESQSFLLGKQNILDSDGDTIDIHHSPIRNDQIVTPHQNVIDLVPISHELFEQFAESIYAPIQTQEPSDIQSTTLEKPKNSSLCSLDSVDISSLWPRCVNGTRICPETPYTYHYGRSRRQERPTPNIQTKLCPKCNRLSWCSSFRKHLQRHHGISQKESKIWFKVTPVTKIPNPDWRANKYSGDNSLRTMRRCAICSELVFDHIFLVHLQKLHPDVDTLEETYESSFVMEIRERLYYKHKYEDKGKALFLNGLKRCIACYYVMDEREFDTHMRNHHASLSGLQGEIVKVDLPLRARIDNVIKVVPCLKCPQILLKNYDYHLRDVHNVSATLARKIASSAKSFTVRRASKIDDSIKTNNCSDG